MNHLINTFSKLKNYIYQCIELFDFSDINRDLKLASEGKLSLIGKVSAGLKNAFKHIKEIFLRIETTTVVLYFSIGSLHTNNRIYESIFSIYEGNISQFEYIKKL